MAPNRSSQPEAQRSYRVAVIGRTGRGDYGHGLDLVWKEIPQARVVAVADENEAGARAAAARTGAKGVYTDYRKMLLAERPDLAAVAPRWVDGHCDMVLACAEAGASVYLEKPMARTPREADQMIDACNRSHVKLQLAYQVRLAPAVAEARRRIAAGELGQLLEMRGRGKEDQRSGGEDLMVLGTHVLDLMRLFAGDPQWAFSHIQQGGAALSPQHVREGNEGLGLLAGDSLHAVYGFPRGVHGTLESKASPDRRGWRFGLDLFGTEGMISIRAGMDPKVHLFKSPSWSPAQTSAAWQALEPAGGLAAAGTLAANQRMVLDLLAAIEADREPAASGSCGRWAIEMALAPYVSQRQGRPVALPLEDRNHPLAGWKVT
ncbi:MAG: Gfo/Idh/MocA family oxidoreductase [Planctomycetes bacterium]|nr:Gfo/Idh/MocA family oxidoreductase [Planctomycetota bacterium]